MVKKPFKKIAAVSLAVIMTMSAAGCGKDKDSGEKSSPEVTTERSDVSESGDKSELSKGEGKYWSENYTFPTENGDIHPYIVYEERQIDAPFTPDEFFEGCTGILCGWYNVESHRADVEKVSDIADFKDGDLSWMVSADKYLPVRTEDNFTELQFINIHDKDAAPGQVYRDMAYTVSIGAWNIFDPENYDHDFSTQINMHNQEDIEKIYFDNFGMPTSAYETAANDSYHNYTFFWETNAYTVSTSVVEFTSYSDKYPTYWCAGDVVYYSANYPKEMIYEDRDENGWTLLWDNGPVEVEWDGIASATDASSTGDGASADKGNKEIQVYKGDALQSLDLKGTLSVDKIDIVYNDISCTIEPGFGMDEMFNIFGEQTNEVDYRNIYKYGTSANENLSHRCPVEFEYTEGEDGSLELSVVGVSLETAATVSIMGIDAYTSAEELAAILGTPTSVGDYYVRDAFWTDQYITWKDLSIGGFDIDYIDAYYFNGELTEIAVVFK